VERQILARLRNRAFFSLEELNEAVSEELILLNEKPFQNQKLKGALAGVGMKPWKNRLCVLYRQSAMN